MAMMSCPDCGNQCSILANTCPKCGRPFIGGVNSCFEETTVKFRCATRAESLMMQKLLPYTSQGWEIFKVKDCFWQGGSVSPVYKVTLRRAK